MNQNDIFLFNIFFGDIPENDNYGKEAIYKLLSLSVEELFDYIKRNREKISEIKPNDIPQFSKFDDIYMVIRVISDSPEKNLNWEKIGYYLCPKEASSAAKTKYGENHYKLAVQLGLAYPGKNIRLTPLGNEIYSIKDEDVRNKIVARLVLRIPIIQVALLNAENKRINMFDCLKKYLSESTAVRRRPNVKTLLALLDSITTNDNMRNVFWNIVWSDDNELS